MAKNKLSKSQMKKLRTNITKYAKDISNTSNQLVKTIEEMNASIYYGGNAANEWYKKADASVTSNVNFLKRLEQTLAKIDNLIKNAERVTGGASDSTVGSTAVAGAGAAAGIGASAGAGLGGGTSNQTASDGDGKGSGGSDKETPKDPSKGFSETEAALRKNESSKQIIRRTVQSNNPGVDYKTDSKYTNNNNNSSKTYEHNDYTPGTYKDPLADYMRTPGADYQKKTFYGTTTPKKRGLFD